MTVVIPSYRGAGTVRRAVESALAQNDGRVAVVVVIDDGCKRTRKRLIDLNDERITVVTNETNMGAPASRNRGLALAATPYVSFLDADDWLEGDFLAPLIRTMEASQADIGFAPSVRWTPQRGYESHRDPDFLDHAQIFSEWLGERRSVNNHSVLWSTSYVRAIGGWDTRVRRNQDGEIALRAVLMGARFVTSKTGVGVWADDRSVGRITTRTDNLGSLLYIVDKFLNIQTDVVPDEIRRRVCARFCLTVAHLAYSSGQDEVGKLALERRRALRVTDYAPDWRYVLSASLRVIPTMPRLFLWRAIRRLRNLVR